MPDGIFSDNQGDPVTVAGWGHTEVNFIPEKEDVIKGDAMFLSNTLQKIDIRYKSSTGKLWSAKYMSKTISLFGKKRIGNVKFLSTCDIK